MINFLVWINKSSVGADANITEQTAQHYNKHYYNPELDDQDTNENITLYGREKPDELDFTDVWDTTYFGVTCPEYFYHTWFCGFLTTIEPEVPDCIL